jgi:16S rRNA (uracil1498-N3)-methyltransferase
MMTKQDKNVHESHVFALWVPGRILPGNSAKNGSQHSLRNKDLIHRIKYVLRLKPEESLILFDDVSVIQAILAEYIGSDGIHITLIKRHSLQPLQPAIRIMLPLLKREALQDAIYSCVEMGATAIDLILTEKTHKKWGGEREEDRLRAIMIAAAEQSKQFSLPTLTPPQKIDDYVKKLIKSNDVKIVFDPRGQPLKAIIDQFAASSPKAITLALGPEGDFTAGEKNLLMAAGFLPCALTPTVLRAQQALILGLGVIRSL